jgi:hypothetical protein
MVRQLQGSAKPQQTHVHKCILTQMCKWVRTCATLGKEYEYERERERERDRDIRGPECQIISEKLHDQRAVLVRLLTQCIQLRNSLVKSLPKYSTF